MLWHADYAPQRKALSGLVGMPSLWRPTDAITCEEWFLDGGRRR